MANPATINRLFKLLQEDPQVCWSINDNNDAVVLVKTQGIPLTEEYVSSTYKRIVHCKKRILAELDKDSFLLEIQGYQIGGLNITNSHLARLHSPISYGKVKPTRVPKKQKPEFNIIFEQRTPTQIKERPETDLEVAFKVLERVPNQTRTSVIEGQLQFDILPPAA